MLENESSRRYSRQLPSLLTAFAIALFSFALGFITAFINPQTINPRIQTLHSNTTLPTDHSTIPVAASDLTPSIPLGLQWYQQSYHNPWQFSTLRTGVDQLNAAVGRVLKRDNHLPRVVVSFTSLPNRFQRHAHVMINLLQKQTYKPDAIYINIPKHSRRSTNQFTIPEQYQNDPTVIILRPEIDYGPATKLIPTIENELKLGNNRTRIITVDDDNEGSWTTDTLLELYAYSLAFEDYAVGLTGWNVTCMLASAHCSPEESGVPHRQYRDRLYNFIRQADDYACHSLSDWLPDYFSHCLGAIRKNYVGFTDVLEGYKGAVYQPRFFDLEHLKSIVRTEELKSFLLCDDVWFSGWLSVRGIERVVVNPAIHNNAPVKLKLLELGSARNLTTSATAYRSSSGKMPEPEVGLHSIGEDFVRANKQSVIWFEGNGGWVKGLWDRPEGFLYPNERNALNMTIEGTGRMIERLQRDPESDG